ncbi:MAG: phage portal protein [[Clostridium] innocuum]
MNKIANLIGSMSIHLMQNTTDKGDIRIRNGLSRKIDIEPNRYMTRSTFIQTIVRALLLEGDGNAVVLPKTKDGCWMIIADTAKSDHLLQDGYGYKIVIYGQTYEPWDLIHIAMNPNPEVPWKGEGYRKSLKQVAETLLQASITKKGFMESKWKPSIIVKVDADTEELSSKKGFSAAGKICDQHRSRGAVAASRRFV